MKKDIEEKIAPLFSEADSVISKIVDILYEYFENDEDLKYQEYSEQISSSNWEKISSEYRKSFENIQGNMYALYIEENKNKKLVYIGTSNNATERIKQHLFSKAENTHSVLDKIKNYILDKKTANKVFYKAITLDKNVRTVIEERLHNRFDLYNEGWSKRHNN